MMNNKLAPFVLALKSDPRQTCANVEKAARNWLAGALGAKTGSEVCVNFRWEYGTGRKVGKYLLVNLVDQRASGELDALSGMIFDVDADFAPVCVPQKRLRFDEKSPTEIPLGATVREMVDATFVTLWPRPDGRWGMSTANCTDVSGLKWMAGGTYGETVSELLNSRMVGGMGALDRSKCHVIGFRHPAFHLACPNAIPELYYAHSFYLGDWSDESWADLGRRYCVTPPAGTWDKMCEIKAPTMAKLAERNNAHPLACLGAKPWYGYTVCDGAATYAYPSKLYRYIRHAAYDLPRSPLVTPLNRTEYIVLRACLEPENRAIFDRVFTGLVNRAARVDTKLKALVGETVDQLRRGGNGGSTACKNAVRAVRNMAGGGQPDIELVRKLTNDVVRDQNMLPCIFEHFMTPTK